MNTALYPVCAAAAWLVACYKFCVQRKDLLDLERMSLLITIVFLAITLTLASPSVWVGIDRMAGWSNLSALLSQGTAVLAAASAQAAVLLWSQPRSTSFPRVKTFGVVTGVILVAMTVLFLVSPQLPERPSDFVAQYASQPRITEYLIVYVLAFGSVQMSVTARCYRYGKLDTKPWLRRGLLVGTVGSALGVVYCGFRMADIVLAHVGVDPHHWETYARSSVGLGILLVAVGFTLPRAGPAMSVLRRWPHNRRAYRDLYPLWQSLYEATPEIALIPSRSPLADRLTVRNLEFRLFRRVIEIMDGLLDLRPYMDQEVESFARRLARAANLTGDELNAAVEASRIRMALCARTDAAATPTTGTAAAVAHAQDSDLSGTIEWLRKVAQAFTSSPVVAKATESSRVL